MKWIPTTEKLPPIRVEVLATLRWDTITIADRIDEYSWNIYEGEADVLNDDILAWMELPKPYKKEEKKMKNVDDDYDKFCRRCSWNDADYGLYTECDTDEEFYDTLKKEGYENENIKEIMNEVSGSDDAFNNAISQNIDNIYLND